MVHIANSVVDSVVDSDVDSAAESGQSGLDKNVRNLKTNCHCKASKDSRSPFRPQLFGPQPACLMCANETKNSDHKFDPISMIFRLCAIVSCNLRFDLAFSLLL